MIMTSSRWRPYATLNDAVKDKLVADAGATASKRAFPDKMRDKY